MTFLDAEDYDDISRRKMVEAIVNHYLEKPQDLFSALNDMEIDFLRNNLRKVKDIRGDKYLYSLFKNTLIYFGLIDCYEIEPRILSLLKSIFDNKKENQYIDKLDKEKAYLTVGLFRCYGVLTRNEFYSLYGKYYKLEESYYYLTHPYVRRFVTEDVYEELYYLDDLYYGYQQVLNTHAKTFKTFYSKEQLINIGKYGFDINTKAYQVAVKDKVLVDRFHLFADDFIINVGLKRYEDCYHYIKYFSYNSEKYLYMAGDVFATMPTFYLTDNDDTVLPHYDVVKYYELSNPFVLYMGKRLGIEVRVKNSGKLDSEDAYKVFASFTEHKDKLELIESYIASNNNLTDEDKDILKDFSRILPFAGIYLKCVKDGYIFTDSERHYLVKGLYDRIDEMVGSDLCYLRTYLLPFKGKIITTGTIETYAISIGPNIWKNEMQNYQSNKDKVIKSL